MSLSTPRMYTATPSRSMFSFSIGSAEYASQSTVIYYSESQFLFEIKDKLSKADPSHNG